MHWGSGGAGFLGWLPHTIAHTCKAPGLLLLLPPTAPRGTKRIFPMGDFCFHLSCKVNLWVTPYTARAALSPLPAPLAALPGAHIIPPPSGTSLDSDPRETGPPPWVPGLVRWTKLRPCPLLTVFNLTGFHLAVRVFFFFSTSPFNVPVCCSKGPSTQLYIFASIPGTSWLNIQFAASKHMGVYVLYHM